MAKMHWLVLQDDDEPKVRCQVMEGEQEVLQFSITRDDLRSMLDAIDRHFPEEGEK